MADCTALKRPPPPCRPQPKMAGRKPKKSVLNILRPNSWVMLHETEGFVRLPHERVIYTSPPRTSLSLQPVNSSAGSERFSKASSSGRVHLTNQRIVYLPSESSPDFQSFSAPLLNLRDTHVAAPFFGPNVWTAQVKPVPGGGIPPSDAVLQLKMTFKDGGAFDFHTNFERIKERLQQAVEVSQDAGAVGGTASGAGAFGGVQFSSVHLEELPAYEGPHSGVVSGATVSRPAATEQHALVDDQCPPASMSNGMNSHSSDRHGVPSEPPPGYEEVQQQSVANALENRLRQSQ